MSRGRKVLDLLAHRGRLDQPCARMFDLIERNGDGDIADQLAKRFVECETFDPACKVKQVIAAGGTLSVMRDPVLDEADDTGTEMRLTNIASDGKLDRMSDVIDPAGWVLDAYRDTNPVILTNHRYAVGNIVGQATAVRVIDAGKPDEREGKKDREVMLSEAERPGQLVLDILVDPPGSSAETDLVRSKIEVGSLRTSSVGFVPLALRFIIDDDTEQWLGFQFIRQELIENSLVPVPANSRALVDVSETPGDTGKAQPLSTDQVARRTALTLDTHNRLMRRTR